MSIPGERLSWIPDIHFSFLSVPMNYCSHADQTVSGNLDVVSDRTIDAEETVFSNFAVAGDNNVRRDEDVVADNGLMSDMISTPQYDVVANPYCILQHVILHDETILSDLDIAPDKRFR